MGQDLEEKGIELPVSRLVLVVKPLLYRLENRYTSTSRFCIMAAMYVSLTFLAAARKQEIRQSI